jgi:hypothetical protein
MDDYYSTIQFLREIEGYEGLGLWSAETRQEPYSVAFQRDLAGQEDLAMLGEIIQYGGYTEQAVPYQPPVVVRLEEVRPTISEENRVSLDSYFFLSDTTHH